MMVPVYLDILLAGHVGELFQERLSRDWQAAGVQALDLHRESIRLLFHEPYSRIDGNYRAPRRRAIAEAQPEPILFNRDPWLSDVFRKELVAAAFTEEVLGKVAVDLIGRECLAPFQCLVHVI